MSNKNENAAIVGVGVAACAACCAGPIIGFLAALGLGAAAGFAVFGALGVFVAAVVAVALIRRRRRQHTAPAPAHQTVSIEPPRVRVPR